jgi:hypothetical protein
MPNAERALSSDHISFRSARTDLPFLDRSPFMDKVETIATRIGNTVKEVVEHPGDTAKKLIKDVGPGTAVGFATRLAGFSIGSPVVVTGLAASAAATGVNTGMRTYRETDHLIQYYRDHKAISDARPNKEQDGPQSNNAKAFDVVWNISYGQERNDAAREKAYGVEKRTERIDTALSIINRSSSPEQLLNKLSAAQLDQIQADLVWSRALHGNTMSKDELNTQRRAYRLVKRARKQIDSPESVHNITHKTASNVRAQEVTRQIVVDVAKTPMRFLIGTIAGQFVRDIMHLDGPSHTAHPLPRPQIAVPQTESPTLGINSHATLATSNQQPIAAALRPAAETPINQPISIPLTEPSHIVHNVKPNEWAIKILIKEGLVKDADLHQADSAEKYLGYMKNFLDNKAAQGGVNAEAIKELKDLATSHPHTSLYELRRIYGIKRFDKLFILHPNEQLTLQTAPGQVSVPVPTLAPIEQLPPVIIPNEAYQLPLSKETPQLGSINFNDPSPIEIDSTTLPIHANLGSAKHYSGVQHGLPEAPPTGIATVKSAKTGAIVGFGHDAYHEGKPLPWERIRESIEGRNDKDISLTNLSGWAQVQHHLMSIAEQNNTITLTQNGHTETLRLVDADYIDNLSLKHNDIVNDMDVLFNQGNSETFIVSFCGRSSIRAINFLTEKLASYMDSDIVKAIEVVSSPNASGKEVTTNALLLYQKLGKIDPEAAKKFLWMYMQREKDPTSGDLVKFAPASPEGKAAQKAYNFSPLSEGRYVLKFQLVK